MRHILVFALAAVACDDDGISRVGGGVVPTGPSPTGPTGPLTNGKGITGSCDMIEVNGTCIEYGGYLWTIEDAQADCASGTFVENEICSFAEPRVGSCRQDDGDGLWSTLYYYDGTYYTVSDAASLESSCTSDGDQWYNLFSSGS